MNGIWSWYMLVAINFTNIFRFTSWTIKMMRKYIFMNFEIWPLILVEKDEYLIVWVILNSQFYLDNTCFFAKQIIKVRNNNSKNVPLVIIFIFSLFFVLLCSKIFSNNRFTHPLGKNVSCNRLFNSLNCILQLFFTI